MSLIEELSAYFPPERVKSRPIDLHAYASDAGFYLLVPKVVVLPLNVEEVSFLFRLARKYDTGVTFRTAGTSLSGQSVTDGILADLSRYWKQGSVEQQGAAVRVQPGLTGQAVNRLLKPFGRKIGPDPASINAAMMGGILSNNSSGMCCGVVDNSYHTLLALQFMLPDGQLYDTGRPSDYERFEKGSPAIFSGILQLKQRITGNPALVGNIRRKYKIKNTVGYGLNAFVDFEHPLDILAHLMIGAEGTLGFISGAVLKTIPDKLFKKTGLLFFSSPRAACDAIGALAGTGAEALEFMDRAALRSIEQLPGAPPFLAGLPAGAACILCEYQADAQAQLIEKFRMAEPILSSLAVLYATEFTTEAAVQAVYWKLRKGMYPSVAAVRAKGVSVMLEDVAVPVEKLGEAIEDLQQLFVKYNYEDALVFGHAKDGNLHFLVSQSVAKAADIESFSAFNDDLADLIIHRYQGSLKAEHGTGRQIAPYVEEEWGAEAYQVMKDLKVLIDPQNLLNPGVLINPDKKSHLKNLKSLPVVEEEVDKCVECGFCEHRCPSRDYTLTPRQRIVLRRTLARLQASGDRNTYDSIVKDYQFDGLDTCAVDGLCATECPVTINTGELVKRLRRENLSIRANKIALRIARHFATAESGIRFLLRAGRLVNKTFGSKTLTNLTKAVKKVMPAAPLWPASLSGPAASLPSSFPVSAAPAPPVAPSAVPADPIQPEAVYFTCCMNRMMGADADGTGGAGTALLKVAGKASVSIRVPSDARGHCCGQAFDSKGFTDAHRYAANNMIDALWRWTEQGRIPVLLDISSCTHSLQHARPRLTEENQVKFDALKIMDGLNFAVDILLPRLPVIHRKDEIILHPVCSLYKMGSLKKLEQLGAATATNPIIPASAGCCGMAGDRGFFYPGLTSAATRNERDEVNAHSSMDCYSTAKPCEMSLSEATGKDYRSVFHLLDEVSE
ncbi:MAG TPA: FAD-binding and (Fe-S)-binding domain-containing protein [Puia sp.]|nr:FAD-binding and (Fe-S)-binding domain-containing protein [Puia sp.]